MLSDLSQEAGYALQWAIGEGRSSHSEHGAGFADALFNRGAGFQVPWLEMVMS